MDPTPTSERGSLAALKHGDEGAGGVSSGGPCVPEHRAGGTRCPVPECPHPAEQEGLAIDAEPSPAPSPHLPAHLAWQAPNFLWRLLWKTWGFAREVSGDDAYERYLGHLTRFHPGQTPMTPAEYFKFRQEQKWSRLSRCC